MSLNEQPLISVIVPIYNAQKYLTQSIDSISRQTYSNLEIICIDDGSTDNLTSLLENLAACDSRIHIFKQQNSGPAKARNLGIEKATGDYVYFVDSDDFLERSLVEEVALKIKETAAEVICIPINIFVDEIGTPIPAEWAFLRDRYPSTSTFTWKDNPDYILRAFENFPFGKFVSKELITANNITFDESVMLTEDLLFSAKALLKAQNISTINKRLYNHREFVSSSLMSTKDKYPLDFLKAFLNLKKWLQNEGLFAELEIGFCNWAADACIYNTMTLCSISAFDEVTSKLAESGFADLGLLTFPQDKWWTDNYPQFIEGVISSPYEYLLRKYREERARASLLDMRLGVQISRSHSIKSSVADYLRFKKSRIS